MIHLLKEEWPDFAKVLGFNSLTFGVVTWTSVEAAGKLLLLALSIYYTAAKIVALHRKRKSD